MASKGDSSKSRTDTIEQTLDEIRERYVEENGEEPPEEFMTEARRQIVLGIAQRDRDAHRDIYDALADE
jgi:hypothetical protein